MNWDECQTWEANWWGNCTNTLGEEMKQLAYAKRMGLRAYHDGKSPFNFDAHGQTVLDIGGGPVSLLLKCHNVKKSTVVDPCAFPGWVRDRYDAAHICYWIGQAEQFAGTGYDEVWCYNCLQHVQNPQRVIERMRSAGKLIRLFEWIDTPVSDGHPHALTEALLNQWLGGNGKVEEINENSAVGRCYYGVFPRGVV